MRKTTRPTDWTQSLQRLVTAIALILLIAVVGWLYNTVSESSLEVGADDTIDVTPTQLESIREIGEWEFLSISDEELVDTIRKGLISDDHLVRIYYGTLRLGINTHRLRQNWLTVEGDTATAIVPKVGLLDERFIDEARTKAFFESGTWKAADREAMYRKAYRQMKAHSLTPVNLKAAEENAEAQLKKMLRTMGFENVVVRFED